MVKAVVFDFDGTLVDSNHLKENLFYEIVKNHPKGLILMKKILSSNASDRYSIIKRYSESQNNIEVSYKKLLSNFNKISTEKVSNAREISGASELLNTLKKHKVDIYLSSATPRYWLLKIISKRKWDGFFKQIFGFPQKKNDSIKKLLNKYDSSEIIIIGDGHDDEESAKNFNCKFFKVNQTKSNQYSLTSPSLHKFIFSDDQK